MFLKKFGMNAKKNVAPLFSYDIDSKDSIIV